MVPQSPDVITVVRPNVIADEVRQFPNVTTVVRQSPNIITVSLQLIIVPTSSKTTAAPKSALFLPPSPNLDASLQYAVNTVARSFTKNHYHGAFYS